MKDSTVKAYSRAFAVLTRALVDKGARIDLPGEIDKCSTYPVDGMTPLFLKAAREGALDARANELIQAFLNEVDPDDELHNKRPLPKHQQGIWLLEYEHWKEFMTPSQAAERLGVTKQRVSALIKNDQLEAVKAGRNWYISSLSVDMRVGDAEEKYVVKQASIRYGDESAPDLREFATEREARGFYDSIDLGRDWRNELQTSGDLEGMKHTTITKELYRDDIEDGLEYEEYSYADYQAWRDQQ